MILICDSRHARIIYDSHESEGCPLCEVKEELRDVEQQLCNREHDLGMAEAAVEDLADRLSKETPQ